MGKGYKDEQGRFRPIEGKKGGGVAKFVVTGCAVAVLGTGGFGGSAALDGALSTGGDVFAGNTGTSVSDALPGRSLKVRKVEGRKTARRGSTRTTFRRFQLKELKRAVRSDAKCVLHSTDRVRKFFLRKPCTSLRRRLLAVGDGNGNAAIISIVWIGFRKKRAASAFERVESVQGSGDITPLGGSAIGLADLRFSGHHYYSRPHGRSRTIVETETATGHVDAEKLDALAEVCSWFPRF